MGNLNIPDLNARRAIAKMTFPSEILQQNPASAKSIDALVQESHNWSAQRRIVCGHSVCWRAWDVQLRISVSTEEDNLSLFDSKSLPRDRVSKLNS